MLKILGILTIGLLAQVALAEEPAAGKDEKKESRFNPPRGFQTRKRGNLVLYCRSDATVGTRFKTEKCYNEAQMRAYVLALEAQKNDIDRIRATCNGGPCVPHEPPSPR